MKKLLVTLLVVAVVLVGGGWVAKQMVMNKVSQKVAATLDEPVVHQQIQTALQAPAIQAKIKEYAAKDSGGLSFHSRQDAVKYVVSHMSPSQALKVYQAYKQPDSLSSSEKKDLAKQVLAQLSPQQLAAIAKAFDTK